MTIIYFILILGITVLVHEFGHFIFAKKFGVHVYEFSLGMGPRLFKFNRKNDETDYCIRLFPIGGFVQMAGEEVEVDEKIPEEKRLMSKPAYQRFMIMVAGVMMNFLLAIVLLFFIGLFNKVSLNNIYISDSSIKGLNNNDKIVAINDHFVNNYDKLALEMAIVGNSNDFTMTVKSDNGTKKKVKISPIGVGKSGLPLEKDYGIKVENMIIIESKVEDIKVGDEIVSINDIEIDNYPQLLYELDKIGKDEFELGVQNKSKKIKKVKITATDIKDDELSAISYGFSISGKEASGFFAAIKYSFLKFFSTLEQMIFTIIYLATGKISLGMLSGPIGIYSVVSVYSGYGLSSLISLLCLICINVGFINLLPLPAFDGGHVLFIIIEKIKGSKVDPKVENTIHNIGFILLMILMIFITYNDILRLFK